MTKRCEVSGLASAEKDVQHANRVLCPLSCAVATVNLALPGIAKAVKKHTSSRPHLSGYQWKSTSELDVFLRSVRVRGRLKACSCVSLCVWLLM